MTHILKFFAYEHLPEHLQAASKPLCELAREMDRTMPDCAEKTAGLRKLLEAKDCFVRAELEEAAMTEPSEVPNEVKSEIIRKMLQSKEGRAKVASSMVQPLTTRLDFSSLFRRVLRREDSFFDTPHKELVPFEIDPDKFDFVGDLVKALMMKSADLRLIGELDRVEAVATDHPMASFQANQEFAKQPGHILMNAFTYSHIRMFCRSDIDLETRPELLRAGIMGWFEKMTMRISRLVEPGPIYYVPETAGRFCDRLSIRSLERTGPGGHPEFEVEHQLCLEVDLDQIRKASTPTER